MTGGVGLPCLLQSWNKGSLKKYDLKIWETALLWRLESLKIVMHYMVGFVGDVVCLLLLILSHRAETEMRVIRGT